MIEERNKIILNTIRGIATMAMNNDHAHNESMFRADVERLAARLPYHMETRAIVVSENPTWREIMLICDKEMNQ